MNEVKVNGEDLVFGLDIGRRSVVGTVAYCSSIKSAASIKKYSVIPFSCSCAISNAGAFVYRSPLQMQGDSGGRGSA